MTTPSRTATVDGNTDFSTSVERQRRVRELEELAAQEGIKLPLPARWIATLEGVGIVVDLVTGAWTLDTVQAAPTARAYEMGASNDDTTAPR